MTPWTLALDALNSAPQSTARPEESEPDLIKACSKCGVKKHLSEFHSRGDDRKKSACKTCCSAARKTKRVRCAQCHKRFYPKSDGQMLCGSPTCKAAHANQKKLAYTRNGYGGKACACH